MQLLLRHCVTVYYNSTIGLRVAMPLFLARPLDLDDGRCLRTLEEAADMVRRLPFAERGKLQWQWVAAALEQASLTGRSDHLLDASAKLERALVEQPSQRARLAEEKKPAAPSIPRRTEARILRWRTRRD
jgi:hypothetical protein